ncbi:uncharacterized protein G6M90_00g108090 [Metarhizium brunneum]|uniref:Uncharacterized protein n=1 Tax=Metarhizium brunneum TaxID=500148 RepID=A0A7D5ZE59_9HYPO|nr:hypothetical protein G6M90_00g108090 [Metarhizium brunneum]
MHEYDHDYESNKVIGKTLAKLMREILEEAGFIDVKEHDYLENVRLML